ncbi:MAG: Cna B-type domain-containing protein [Eubacterium sp.]|nr:Cna B-type domain-containing protein [Eubacterium sp.]
MKKNFVLGLICAVFGALALSVTAFADDGSIELDCDVEGITYKLYGVDDYYEVDGEVYDNVYYAYKIDPNGSSADYTASAYILRDDVSASYTAVTDSDGEVVFSGLDGGDYLLVAEVYSDGEYVYVATPVVVSVYSSTVTSVSGKISVATVSEAEDVESVSALKVWSGDYDDETLAQGITVQLLRDGEVYDERELNSSNNWRCTWTNLVATYNWLVVEKEVPDGYMLNIEHDGTVFIITNSTLKGDPEGGTEGTTEGENETTTESFGGEKETTTEADVEVTTTTKSGRSGGGRSKTVNPETETETAPSAEKSESPTSGGSPDSPADDSEPETTPEESNPDEPDTEITSAGNSEPHESEPSESGESLPQTGQLWFPVPILSCGGALFLIIGIGRRRMS